ncbi:hypothetical protein KIMH_07330 [Bombiscardovia apis]|uniref:Uncharacterized protein n=1 Tax=Bombiscardovia apis TaxID=2932182 RepID=A0ABM8BCL3_9BIFI|nr:hypothetical protein KIMH_07330 [Bombiscardovia apis]
MVECGTYAQWHAKKPVDTLLYACQPAQCYDLTITLILDANEPICFPEQSNSSAISKSLPASGLGTP